MTNGIGRDDPRGFNKGHSSKFRVGFRVRQTPEKGRSTYRPKRCGNNNKDEDNSPKTLDDKNFYHCLFFSMRSLLDEVANVLICDKVVSEFELQSRNYFHFQINTYGKIMNPLIPTGRG